MKALSDHIQKAIITRATELIPDLPTTLETPDRSKREADLDVFFARNSFGCNQAQVIELVSLLYDYKMVVPVKVKADPFTILYCQTCKVFWMALAEEHGFSSLEKSQFHIDAGCERMATQDEARKFLEGFAKVDSERFL